MRTHEIMAALANRHAGGEWAYVEEVANSTGGPASRAADAMALNLWPSRGLELHGFEVKASRSDWLRELKAPEKADVLFGYCNRWWVVVGEKGIVQDGELPPTWGLLVPRGNDLVVKVQAPALDPKPLSRHFIAAFVRRATANMVPASVVEQRVANQIAQSVEQANARAERAEEECERFREAVAAFERTSGVRISQYAESGERIGSAVKLVLEGGVAQAVRDLEYVVNHAERTVEQLRGQLVEAQRIASNGRAA